MSKRIQGITGLILLCGVLLALGGCCYKQSFGPAFGDDAKASKDTTWYFGFRTMPNPVISPPLLFDDRLYVTTLGGMFVALDKERGQPVKSFAFNGGKKMKAGFRAGPVSDGKLIYVTSYDHNVYAVEPLSGGEKWRFDTGAKIEGAAAIMGGNIYVGTWGGNLYCIKKENGQKLWRFVAEDGIRGTPAAFGGFIYFGDKSGNFYCIEAGEEHLLKWSVPIAGDEIYGEPAVDGENVWFGSLDGNIYCLDAVTGKRRWVKKTGGEIWASPFIDTIILDSSGAEIKPVGKEKALELDLDELTESLVGKFEDAGYVKFDEQGIEELRGKLEEIAKEHTPDVPEVEEPPAEEGEVIPDDALVIKRLYIGSMDAKFYILDALTGEPVTYVDEETGETLQVEPFEIAEGVPYDQGVQGSAVTDDEKVYFGACDFKFRALDKFTGKLIWDYATYGEIRSKPLVYDGKVVFGSDDNYFYGLKTKSGKPVKGAL